MSAPLPDQISNETLDHLHPKSIVDPRVIQSLLHRWMQAATILRRGTNRSIEIETAKIASVGSDEVVLVCTNFDSIADVLFLSTDDHGVPYFCNAQVKRRDVKVDDLQRVSIFKPTVIYRAERRDRTRRRSRGQDNWISLFRIDGRPSPARVVDSSGDGLGVVVPPDEDLVLGEELRVEGQQGTDSMLAVVRNRRTASAMPRWTRIGLELQPVARGSRLRVESAMSVLNELGGLAKGTNASLLAEEPNVVEFLDHANEKIVGILDERGTIEGAPGILMPSAWGKTKETLAGLSATLLETFASIDSPVSVLRIDGIRKRGESTNDPECGDPRLANLNYTFSQGASDLRAAARYLQDVRGVGPIVIVSFSVASVEARRAVALDMGNRFCGWISVVGATDPQSLIRVISGGVDYLGGAERGIRFGRQEVQGLLLDIDRTAEDAIKNRIAFLEDARRDFSVIKCPVTWILGSHDAWTDLRRVEDALSFGATSVRRLLMSNTGHQIRSSRAAAEIFGVIASESVRMTKGRAGVQPVAPEARSSRRRQSAERRRLRKSGKFPDLRSFWRDYLVGRAKSLGMELVTETSSYRSLVKDQISSLEIEDRQTILDLGSGVSTFSRCLAVEAASLSGVRVLEVDYVVEGLKRGRQAIAASSQLIVNSIVADLNPSFETSIPLSDCCADRVIASLILNYVSDPDRFLRRAWSVLRPGGRITLSVLRKDADTSKICVDGIAELRSGKGVESFGPAREHEIDRTLGSFINDAGRLLDFEEQGIFRFWDRAELERCARKAGFTQIRTRGSFGSPAQAWLLSAIRPA